MANDRAMLRRARDSLSGLREGWSRDRAFRSHVAFSALALATLVVVQPPTPWVLACVVLLAIGLAAELINGAVEALLDRLHPETHSAIGAAKDMSSAAAFVINAAAVLVLLGAVLSSLMSRSS